MLWFHCDDGTGEIVSGGLAKDAAEASLNPPETGKVMCLVPDGAVDYRIGAAPDFTKLRDFLSLQIDAEANAVRDRVIKADTGLKYEYDRAIAQARTFQAQPEAGPFLALEADVNAGTIDPRTGTAVTTLEQAADLVLSTEAYYGAKADAIRNARLVAKGGVKAAETLPAILAAGQVDWAAVLPS